MGFSQGLSGLNAASQGLDVVGNNIANSQTVGFKSGSVAFADIFAGSQVGMGVQVAGVNQNFGDGTLGMGTKPLDMGIQGQGFFRLLDSSGKVQYSRNGQFDRDKDGYIYNTTNKMFLTGYQASGTPPSIQPGAPVDKIQIPNGQMPGRASDAGTITGNLCADSTKVKVPENTPFKPNDPKSYNSVTQMDAYDSLGNKHTINVYFVKTDDGKWTAYSRDTTAPASADDTTPAESIALEFDESGNLKNTPANLPVSGGSVGGSAPLTFNIDLSDITQQGGDYEKDGAFVSKDVSTTGYAPGQMNGFTIGDGGEIMASYSNGQQQLIGQVVLANFTNPGGLSSQGNNCWVETPQSGQPIIGASGSGNLGNIAGGMVEASNVDMGAEMVNMIVFQRDYQSNAQTIKTQSEILQTLVNLG